MAYLATLWTFPGLEAAKMELAHAVLAGQPLRPHFLQVPGIAAEEALHGCPGKHTAKVFEIKKLCGKPTLLSSCEDDYNISENAVCKFMAKLH